MKYVVIPLLVLNVIMGAAEGASDKSNINSIEDMTRELRQLAEVMTKKALNVFEDPSDMSVYYNLKDNRTIVNMLPRPWYRPGQMLRLPFIGEPCACSGLQCGCCAGIRITQLNIDRKICANITYDPNLFSITMEVVMGNTSLAYNTFSAKNPPPVCIPLLINGIPTGIDFCVKLFDIYTPGYNLHVCIDFETRFIMAPVLVLHFDCVVMGQSGVSLVKPDMPPDLPPSGEEVPQTTQANVDTYDEITEIKNEDTTLMPPIQIGLQGQLIGNGSDLPMVYIQE